MNNFWLHPALIMLVGALIAPLVPERLRKGWLLLVPIAAFARVFSMSHGTFGEIRFLDWTMTFGRVDRLSQVFGYIMSLMAIIGTLSVLIQNWTATFMGVYKINAAVLALILGFWWRYTHPVDWGSPASVVTATPHPPSGS